MADTLETLELQVKHSASGAADEINRVTSSVRSLGRALEKVLPTLRVFKDTMAGNTTPINFNDNRTAQFVETINNVKQASSGAKAATRDISKGLNNVATAAGRTHKPLGNFLSSLKRIAFYRMLRTIIKEIAQAFQEGLQWAYQFSQGVDGEGNRFASAMDRIKTAGTTMKAQLGSAFISLLAAVEPVIVKLANLITQLADAMSQIFAAFTGTTYLKAAEVPQQWADAAGNAGRAAKEWKNQLLGFDEINRLEEPSKGGGGSSANAVDPTNLFSDTPIEQWAMEFHDKIEKIREKIQQSGVVEAWERLKKAAEKFTNSEFYKKIKEIIDVVVDSSIDLILDTIRDSLNIIADIISGDLYNGVKDIKDLLVDLSLDPLILLAKIFDKIFGTDVAGWFAELKERLKIWDPTTTEGYEKLASAVENLKEAWEKLKSAIHEITDALGIFLDKTGVAKKLQDWIVWFFELGFDVALEGIAWWVQTIADKASLLADILKGDLYNGVNDLKDLLVDTVLGVIETIANLIDRIFGTDLAGWVSDLSDEIKAFNLSDWFGLQETTGEFTKLFTETLPKLFDDFKEWWGSLTLDPFHIPSPHFEWTYTEAEGLIAKALEFVGLPATIPHLNISWYAQGGFPQEGDLFFANERGAEMVGSMNGRTAVANNDQIVEGIRQGVFEAVSAAMNNGGQDVNVKVYLDSHQIKAGQQRLSRAMGV